MDDNNSDSGSNIGVGGSGKYASKRKSVIPLVYWFLFEIAISIWFKSVLTFVLALFEYSNPLFDLKMPKQNYNRILQDLVEQLILKIKTKLLAIPIPIVTTIFSIVIQPIEALMIGLNAMVTSFETMGYFHCKCGWIEIFRSGLLIYHLAIFFW